MNYTYYFLISLDDNSNTYDKKQIIEVNEILDMIAKHINSGIYIIPDNIKMIIADL